MYNLELLSCLNKDQSTGLQFQQLGNCHPSGLIMDCQAQSYG
jgi:hypothetical protein